MAEKQIIDAMWDDSPVDVSNEVNFIWSIANKLRGTYQSDKYKDVIIPMTIIRRFECALEPTKQAVVSKYKENPKFPAKAMYRVSGFQFYNTSEYTLKELINDPDNLAENFKTYLQSFHQMCRRFFSLLRKVSISISRLTRWTRTIGFILS